VADKYKYRNKDHFHEDAKKYLEPLPCDNSHKTCKAYPTCPCGVADMDIEEWENKN
jgi:hypothetical protein